MEIQQLKKSKIRYLILSRGRSNAIISHILFPFADVVVPESEKEDYQKKIKNNIITTPDNIKGLSSLRNYVLDNFEEKIIIMIDDDICKFLNLEYNIYTPI